VAGPAGAYRPIDELVLAQHDVPRFRHQDFQHPEPIIGWEGYAVLGCSDGNATALFAESIDRTDFPQPGHGNGFVDKRHKTLTHMRWPLY
jgi:hypothetical protein